MTTFIHSRYRQAELHAAQAKAVAKALRESTPTATSRPAQAKLPGDPYALRGIPAIGGRGSIGGAIRGSRPGDTLDNLR